MHESKFRYDWTKDTCSWVSVCLQIWLIAAAAVFVVPIARHGGKTLYAHEAMKEIWRVRHFGGARFLRNDFPPHALFQAKTFPVLVAAAGVVGIGLVASGLKARSRFRARIVVVAYGSAFTGGSVVGTLVAEHFNLLWDLQIHWHAIGWWYQMALGSALIVYGLSVWRFGNSSSGKELALES